MLYQLSYALCLQFGILYDNAIETEKDKRSGIVTDPGLGAEAPLSRGKNMPILFSTFGFNVLDLMLWPLTNLEWALCRVISRVYSDSSTCSHPV